MDFSALPPQVLTVINKLLTTFSIPLPGGFTFAPNYLQAVLMVVLIFLLIYTVGHLRHTYVDWSVKGIMPGLAFGFALTLILEGLFLIGGKTVFTEILGWKDAPKPISNVLDTGREKLVDVLGVRSEIPSSNAATPETVETIMSSVGSLRRPEQERLKKLLCNP